MLKNQKIGQSAAELVPVVFLKKGTMGKKLTIKQIEERVSAVSEGALEVVDVNEYLSKDSPMTFKHVVCGNTFKRSLGNVIHNKVISCPACRPSIFPRTEDLLRMLLMKHNISLIEVVDTKYGSGDRGRCIMNLPCGCKVERRIGNTVVNGCRCPQHSEGYMSWKSREDYNKALKELPFGSFEIEGDFINASRKSKMKCLKCGDVSFEKFHTIRARQGKCKNCFGSTKSVYEEYVAILLSDLGVRYERQYKLESYFYDFYLPDQHLLLEYDGEQHSLEVGTTIYCLENNDEIKNELAIKSGYKLHRIRHTESKVKSILSVLEGSTTILKGSTLK